MHNIAKNALFLIIPIILILPVLNPYYVYGGSSGTKYNTFINSVKRIDLRDLNLTNGDIKQLNVNPRTQNGTVYVNAPYLLYSPDTNFKGTDSVLIPVKGTNESPITIDITVSGFPFISDPLNRSVAAFLISIGAVTAIIFIVRLIITRFRSPEYPQYKARFSDIIRTPDWDPSLSIFQFFLWTIVVLFSFFGIYLIRILAGFTDPPQGGIPANLLAIMGISVVVPFVSNYISTTKKIPPPKQYVGLSAMLNENDKPSLSRFQMFAWTWIGIIIYLFAVFSEVANHYIQVNGLVLPNVDPTLVVLMGLSQVAFLGGKAITLPTKEPPLAKVDDIHIDTKKDAAAEITLIGTPSDPNDTLTYSKLTSPKNGTLTDGSNANAVKYTPKAGFTGTDSFTFKATDSKGRDSNIGNVSITVSS